MFAPFAADAVPVWCDIIVSYWRIGPFSGTVDSLVTAVAAARALKFEAVAMRTAAVPSAAPVRHAKIIVGRRKVHSGGRWRRTCRTAGVFLALVFRLLRLGRVGSLRLVAIGILSVYALFRIVGNAEDYKCREHERCDDRQRNNGRGPSVPGRLTIGFHVCSLPLRVSGIELSDSVMLYFGV